MTLNILTQFGTFRVDMKHWPGSLGYLKTFSSLLPQFLTLQRVFRGPLLSFLTIVILKIVRNHTFKACFLFWQLKTERFREYFYHLFRQENWEGQQKKQKACRFWLLQNSCNVLPYEMMERSKSFLFILIQFQFHGWNKH